LAAALQVVAAGGDVGQHLLARRAHRVPDAGLDAGFVVVREEAGLAPLVERWVHRLEPERGPAIDVAPHVLVDAEDLLDDDHPALALAGGRGVVGGKREVVGRRRRDADRLAHAGSPRCFGKSPRPHGRAGATLILSRRGWSAPAPPTRCRGASWWLA